MVFTAELVCICLLYGDFVIFCCPQLLFSSTCGGGAASRRGPKSCGIRGAWRGQSTRPRSAPCAPRRLGRPRTRCFLVPARDAARRGSFWPAGRSELLRGWCRTLRWSLLSSRRSQRYGLHWGKGFRDSGPRERWARSDRGEISWKRWEKSARLRPLRPIPGYCRGQAVLPRNSQHSGPR